MYLKKFSRCAGNLFIVIGGGDLDENGDVSIGKLLYTSTSILETDQWSILQAEMSHRCMHMFIRYSKIDD